MTRHAGRQTPSDLPLTLLAPLPLHTQVAHHTDCTFIRVSGSELVQKYIGEGSRMVRELFVMTLLHSTRTPLPLVG